MIWFPCADGCAPNNPWTCKEDLRSHELAQEAKPSDCIVVRCCNCGTEAELPAAEWKQACEDQEKNAKRRCRANLTRYPRIEPQSGVLVSSREDEKRVWKAKGYHEAPHGVDERTFTETDYRIKERYKPRVPGWRNLRRFA